MPCAPRNGTFSSPAGDLFHTELTTCHCTTDCCGLLGTGPKQFGGEIPHTQRGKNEIGPWQRHRYVCVLLRVALSYKIMRVLSEIMYELNQLHTPWPVMVYSWILVCTDIHEDTTCSHIRMNWHCRTTEKMGSPCYLRNACSHLLPVKLCLGDKAW